MPKFSERSNMFLDECHPLIQQILNEAIKYYDFSVTEGHRGKTEQDEKVELGLSKTEFPHSKHNKNPSEAVHTLPYPFHGWGNTTQFVYMAGYITAIADRVLSDTPYRLRWGGNWDMDSEMVTDQSFDDLAHFELKEK